MNWWKKDKGGKKRPGGEEMLSSPLAGEVVPLETLRDETFAGGILGTGVGVIPAAGVLCAPIDGRVDQTFETGHAITLVSEGGAEILLHVGMDTVELGGKHFELLVESGDRVRAGQELIRFDREAIARAGYELATPMVITNSQEYHISVVAKGRVMSGDPLLKLTRR
ncbi:MAG: PTS glucose transporter subunit IIA [Ruminococcaceae bacterium]|nr:PTS glucose transporter subunit IIA [Oscillospiraceae bacterium]